MGALFGSRVASEGPASRGLAVTEHGSFRHFLIFSGSQASFFALTTAPQSAHRNRPGFGFAFDFPFWQLTGPQVEITQSVEP